MLVNEERCTGCEVCLLYCPTGAIGMENGTLQLWSARDGQVTKTLDFRVVRGRYKGMKGRYGTVVHFARVRFWTGLALLGLEQTHRGGPSQGRIQKRRANPAKG